MDVQRDLDAPMQLFIGGKFVDASDGGVFEVIDPATERSLGAVANGTVEDARGGGGGRRRRAAGVGGARAARARRDPAARLRAHDRRSRSRSRG